MGWRCSPWPPCCCRGCPAAGSRSTPTASSTSPRTPGCGGSVGCPGSSRRRRIWCSPFALVRARFVPRLPAILSALVTVAAVVPDQLGQACWITTGLTLARGPAPAYLAYEARIFAWTAAWGATLYTIGALGLDLVLRRRPRLEPDPQRAVGRALAAVPGGQPRAAARGGPRALVAAGNAPRLRAADALAGAGHRAGHAADPPRPAGRPLGALAAPAPRARSTGSPTAAGCAPGVSSRPRSPCAATSRTSSTSTTSSPPSAWRALVPAGLELQRLGPGGRHALFTFLTYRHGHFGPRLLGPLRRLLPSPVQSNWRIHVRDPRTGAAGSTSSPPPSRRPSTRSAPGCWPRGCRCTSPARPRSAARGGAFHLRLDPGAGSAPDAEAVLTPVETPADGPLAGLLRHLARLPRLRGPPGSGLRRQTRSGAGSSASEIDLGIPLGACQPLTGEVRSRAARAIAGRRRGLRLPGAEGGFSLSRGGGGAAAPSG